MGNVPSSYFEEKDEDPFWIDDVRSVNKSGSDSDAKSRTIASQNRDLASAKLNFSETELSEDNKQKLNEFKLELARKHEKKRLIIEEKRKEMDELREEVERLKRENEQLKSTTSNEQIEILRKENEELRSLLKEKSSIIEESEIIIRRNHELRISIVDMQNDLQRLNNEVLNFDNERQDYRRHVVALKDVIAVSKNMLQIRESQLKELKEKVETIEKSVADRETTIMSADLKQEYERQIGNMRHLRVLYEDRQRAERKEKEELASQLEDAKKDIEQQNKKHCELEERISELELDNSKKYDEIKTLESNLGLTKAENRQHQEELAVINQLFSETLLRFNTSQELDLDKLQKHLEDHHGLLKDIVINEVSSEVSYALPKLLLELINQLHAGEADKDDQEVSIEDAEVLESVNASSRHQMNSAEEIVENLPKVWRVLIELLSHQAVPTNVLTDDEEKNENPCYKKVETAKGPSLVLSVSQTFIRLKDLILEKKCLEKETSHLKHLNGHLENRLQDQEKRLELVQNELSKTWLVVGKLQKQHQMLHTQEKILRYELAQKRKLLNELKEELEDSREKWTQAREKNSTTEQQWKQLRTEFASRRNTTTNEDLNNSAESGYSDDREGSSDDEPGYETDVSECDKKNAGEIEGCGDKHSSGETEMTGTSTKELVEIPEKSQIEASEQKVNLASSRKTAQDYPQLSSISEEPSTSSNVSETKSTFDDILARREERLKRLEASSLVTKAANTANMDVEISNKLDKICVESTDLDEEGTQDQTLKGLHICGDEHSIRETETTGTTTNGSRIEDQDDNLEEAGSSKLNISSPGKAQMGSISEEPGTSNASETKPTLEEILTRREERLKRLEGQASSLVTKAANTANRSAEISSKLDNLHEMYGESNDNAEEETEDQADTEQ